MDTHSYFSNCVSRWSIMIKVTLPNTVLTCSWGLRVFHQIKAFQRLTIGINMFWHKHWHKQKLHSTHQKLHSTFSRSIFLNEPNFQIIETKTHFPPLSHYLILASFESLNPLKNCQPKFDDTSGATCPFFSSPWGILTTKTFLPGDVWPPSAI